MEAKLNALYSKYLKEIQFLSKRSALLSLSIRKHNLKNIFYLILLAIPINIVTIIAYTFFDSAGNANDVLVNKMIVIIHSAVLVTMVIFLWAAFLVRNKYAKNRFVNLLIYHTIGILNLAGIAISSVLQLTTDSINTVIVISTFTAIAFIIRPLHMIIIYLLTYAVLFMTLSIFQHDAYMLAANRLNSAIFLLVSFLLYLLLWMSRIRSLNQKKTIEQQNALLEDKNKELSMLASYDRMTGLLNRYEFENIVSSYFSVLNGDEMKTSIAIVDIDDFKFINDTYGHPSGDKLIKEFARTVMTNLRRRDSVSRWGGDEILILYADSGLDEAMEATEKIRNLIETTKFGIGLPDTTVTVSAGVAELAGSFEETYHMADKALYLAKSMGKNSVKSYRDVISEPVK